MDLVLPRWLKTGAAVELEIVNEIVRTFEPTQGEQMEHNLIVLESCNSTTNATEDWGQNVRSLMIESNGKKIVIQMKFQINICLLT